MRGVVNYQEDSMSNTYATCHVCGASVQVLRKTGVLARHYRHSTRTPSFRELCTGSGQPDRPSLREVRSWLKP